MIDNKKTVDQSPFVKNAILMFAFYGFWCPLWWSSKWKYGYKFFSILMILMLTIWFSCQMISVVINFNDVTQISINFLTFTPALNSFCKVMNILINRKNIIELLNMMKDNYSKARDQREIDIRRKYETIRRSLYVMLIILALVTYLCVCIKPFLNNWNGRILPFLSWFPYTIETEMTFWYSYAYQCTMVSIVATTCVGNDIIVVSVMIQISNQFELLNHRLSNSTDPNFIESKKKSFNWIKKCTNISDVEKNKKRELIDNIHYHRFIFRLCKATQQCFVATFAAQMLVSFLGNCTSAYLFSRFRFGSPDFNSAALVFACLTMEAFLYCWFGNEVRLKSQEVGDAVYNKDWTNLNLGLQKDLLTVSVRSRRPILFKSGPTLALSNDVFVAILKASYTAFTVLKQVGDRSSVTSGI